MRLIIIISLFVINMVYLPTTLATTTTSNQQALGTPKQAIKPVMLNVSWDQFNKDVKTLAVQLKAHAPKTGWKSIVAITRGGLIPAGILSHELNIPLIETIGVGSYQNKQQKALRVFKPFTSQDNDIIVVDDLSDTGNTFRAVQKYLPNAMHVAAYTKPKGSDAIRFYVKEFPQNAWIVFPWETD